MKLQISQSPVWGASVEDRPAALAEKLETLSGGGVNLEFMLARRAPESPGRGVVFISPIKGAKQHKAAREAGFMPTEALHSIRIEGADAPSLGAFIARRIAESGVNIRGFSASVTDGKFVGYLALDDIDEARQVAKTLRKLK